MADAFFEEEGSRLLKATAFEFVLQGEMKRAVRSQNFLTLVVLETQREWDGITVTADDGVRLFVDGTLLIDRWVNQSATTYTASVALSSGPHTVVMEYYENAWDAVARLSVTHAV